MTKIVQLQQKEIEDLKKEIDHNKGPNEQIELDNLYACDDKIYYYEDQENNRKGHGNFYSEARDYYQNWCDVKYFRTKQINPNLI